MINTETGLQCQNRDHGRSHPSWIYPETGLKYQDGEPRKLHPSIMSAGKGPQCQDRDHGLVRSKHNIPPFGAVLNMISLLRVNPLLLFAWLLILAL
jgi:hypothetical protein